MGFLILCRIDQIYCIKSTNNINNFIKKFRNLNIIKIYECDKQNKTKNMSLDMCGKIAHNTNFINEKDIKIIKAYIKMSIHETNKNSLKIKRQNDTNNDINIINLHKNKKAKLITNNNIIITKLDDDKLNIKNNNDDSKSKFVIIK